MPSMEDLLPFIFQLPPTKNFLSRTAITDPETSAATYTREPFLRVRKPRHRDGDDAGCHNASDTSSTAGVADYYIHGDL